jgi:hypothetical protein
MDARTVPLRLLAAALCLLWLLVAAALFVAYRPGGPYDVLVALAAALPAAIAALGIVVRPISPAVWARGRRCGSASSGRCSSCRR